MADGQPTAIEIKGITRNRTKIGVEDGMAEDLINLRFVNGAWRTSGDGRLIDYTMNRTYTQLFIHTNVYRHLLGVYEGTLYWFASIASDGVTFYPLDNTTSRTNWPTEFQDLPTAPVALTTVHGDLWITQTGHLLTVIDGEDDFEYFVFKTSTNEYITVDADVNGRETDRSLYPYGKIHFNLATGDTEEYIYSEKDDEQSITLSTMGQAIDDTPAIIPDENEETTHAAAQIWHAQLLSAVNKAIEDNRFVGPLLVCAAIKLYDGSYVYASNPVLLNPREKLSMDDDLTTIHNGFVFTSEVEHYQPTASPNMWGYKVAESSLSLSNDYEHYTIQDGASDIVNVATHDPVISTGAAYLYHGFGSSFHQSKKLETVVRGSDILISIEDIQLIVNNPSVFTGLGIFITPQVLPFKSSSEDYKEGKVRFTIFMPSGTPDPAPEGQRTMQSLAIATYNPPRLSEDKIISELLHSPFYLLRDIPNSELRSVTSSFKIDMSEPIYEGVLKNIVQQNTLTTEAFARTTYLPKVSYMYNNRLHIANYKSYPFFGYPIDLFHLHNHSVKVQADSWFPNDSTKKVLPNLTGNNDEYLQYAHSSVSLSKAPALVSANAPVFIVKVYIDTAQGEQIVTRFIRAYDYSTAAAGRADFVEDLNPLLSYPDARAKKMEIYRVSSYNATDVNPYQNHWIKAGSQVTWKSFDLKPHPYLNIAYYIEPDLKPIKFSTFSSLTSEYYDAQEQKYFLPALSISEVTALAGMQNTEEHFPNGLKVSKTDNPMFFPVENTYQVGSAEIIALCSNAIAVGTGQTGAAPLYVFCADGLYALFVDASGQMTYTNARVIARDVCNNPHSVTPTDQGVVFTTDRGLMSIAGEQVQEIGEPAEGDVLQFANSSSADYIQFIKERMQYVATLPTSLCDATDFLTYLKDGAIVNYNHNERELIISNPTKVNGSYKYPYSYVLDREGNWSRRDYTADEYVNNYPTSYRFVNGEFYKVDEEGDSNTSLEQRKEADNKFFYLSNVIKLGSIGFKEAHRFVVRGYFEGIRVATGTINNTDVYVVDNTSRLIETSSIGSTIQLRYTSAWGQTQWILTSGFPAGVRIINQLTGEDVTDTIAQSDATVTYSFNRTTMRIGCYVLGSYDGRKWAVLGGNEKQGKFTDIGCKIERTDVKFLRLCLAGQVTGKTRIDYMEISSEPSVLNKKIR